jgi:hypothetical protein
MTIERSAALTCHPSSARPEPVRKIEALARRSASAELWFTYRLDGDIGRIRIPPPSVPRIATRLWQHTCFEAFIAVQGQPAYHEFNFAPSGEWAAYAFSNYRSGRALGDEMIRPQIAVRSSNSRLEVDTLVRLNRLSAAHPRASLCIGLSAVIETGEGLSYWSLRHPAGKPDFHDADGFAMLLEPPDPDS